MTKLQDVADIAGVSTATVSRTLNSPDLVDPTTRSKVESVIRSVGYQRNETARSLAKRSTRTIGLLADTFSSSYFTTIMDETSKFLQEHDHYSIVEVTGNEPEEVDEARQLRAWRSLINRQVDGIIILSLIAEEAMVETLINEFPATVVMSLALKKNCERYITFDDEAGGRIAAEHLIEKGHTNIATVTGPLYKMDSILRHQGFEKALARQGVDLPESHIWNGNYTVESGKQAMLSILKSPKKFTAMFAHNDNMAIGAISACYEAGVNVPNDISIIGYDDSPLATISLPPLTTIKQPLKSMSRAAAALALNFSRTRQGETQISTPQTHFVPSLVERQSVRDLSQ